MGKTQLIYHSIFWGNTQMLDELPLVEYLVPDVSILTMKDPLMVDLDLGHYWLKDYPVPNYHCIWNTFVFHTFLFVNNDQWFHRFMIIDITGCPASITHSLSTCSLTGNICFTEGHCLYSVQCTAVYSAVVASCTTLLLWLLCNSSLDREYEAPGHL